MMSLPEKNHKFFFSTFPCHSFKIFPTHRGKVLLSTRTQQNLSCTKYDLEPGPTQGAQASPKGDRTRDRAGDEATIYGWGSMQEASYLQNRAEVPPGGSARDRHSYDKA